MAVKSTTSKYSEKKKNTLQSSVLYTLTSELLEAKRMNKSYGGVRGTRYYERVCLYFCPRGSVSFLVHESHPRHNFFKLYENDTHPTYKMFFN